MRSNNAHPIRENEKKKKISKINPQKRDRKRKRWVIPRELFEQL